MRRAFLRRLGWDRNPLRRRTDRAEAWLNAVLFIALVVVGTALATYTGRAAYRGEARAAAWDRAHRFEVWAVLLEKPAPDRNAAQARWKAPDGKPRTGPVTAAPGSAAGTWLPIWVDETGAVAAEPMPKRPATHAAEIATVSVALVVAVLAALRMVGRRLLDRRRLRSWQDEWLDVGPRWSNYR